jgi:hypothetical protein
MEAVTVRQPAMANFMLDSADRNFQGAAIQVPPSGVSPDTQPWNDFLINKPAPMLDSFARRIAVTEVQFPWAIPNVTAYNNSFYISWDLPALTQKVTIPVGFYTGVELAAAVQAAIMALPTPPTAPMFVTYDAGNRTFTIEATGSPAFILNNNASLVVDYTLYYSQPSLLRTMGITPNQMGTVILTSITGISTMIRYTDFVDITSGRMNTNSDAKDGTTKLNTIRDYIVRIYIGNDINTYLEDPNGVRPFEIHRQIVHPKFIRMNPEQFLTSLDIQVRDMYGNLVWLPPGSTYPDFKLTCIASEQ